MSYRRVFADVTPLRDSPEFRLLYTGQVVSLVGRQLTVVAVAYQVFQLTGSSLTVGLVRLGQFLLLLVGSTVGGATADALDRRRLMLAMQTAARRRQLRPRRQRDRVRPAAVATVRVQRRGRRLFRR
ncbi:MAG: MFS transporter [Actinomycetota bacterium]|nr:MFS transporter [Actinomycetota bacterium]